MEITIKPLTAELIPDYFDFFNNRAFTDNPPWGGCYCICWQMTKAEEQAKLVDQVEANGGGEENFMRALREVVVSQITSGALRGYLAYADGVSIGWCNANDKANFPVESANGAILRPNAVNVSEQEQIEKDFIDYNSKLIKWQPAWNLFLGAIVSEIIGYLAIYAIFSIWLGTYALIAVLFLLIPNILFEVLMSPFKRKNTRREPTISLTFLTVKRSLMVVIADYSMIAGQVRRCFF